MRNVCRGRGRGRGREEQLPNSPPIPPSATSTRETADDGWIAHQLTDRAANAIADLALLDAELRGHRQPVDAPTPAEPLNSPAPVVADAAHCEPGR